MAETIKFETSDGVTIVGDWYQAEGEPKATLLLLHMMPADRSSWVEFATLLTKAGYNALAIDERGHGESTAQGDEVLDYKLFTDEQQQAKRLDVDAALDWIQEKGFMREKTGVIGGSIGANLAIDLGARDERVLAIGALSPGLEYRGIRTKKLAKALRSSQFLFLTAAEDDEYSFKSVQTLQRISGAPVEGQKYSSGGHATALFSSQPTVMTDLITWLNSIYKS